MKYSAIISILMATAAISLTGAYDIGCVYPDTMPDPMAARTHIHRYSGSYLIHAATETPVALHVSGLSSLCQIGCLAYHDEDVLDPMTMERPGCPAPSDYHNAWATMLCTMQCFDIIVQEGGQPDLYQPFWDKWGLDGMIEPRDEDLSFVVGIAMETGDYSNVKSYLEEKDFNPFAVGQVVGSEVLVYVLQDGWNAIGEKTYDLETGTETTCTANCRNYQDTTGYFPKNYPTGEALNSTNKYIVEGKDKYWQPLTDSDGQGYFSAQEHVTPHIGFKAKTRLYESVDEMPEAPDPEYDFRAEALLVVDRLKNASSDPIKKQKIAFYDAKLMVINLVESEVKKQFRDNYSFQEELLYIEGMAAGEHDATILAWREKVRHDIVRPTTVIKRWGSDELETFSGDRSADGPATIKARDFEAFLRVMPHAEYPSGSACICTAYGEFTDAYTMELYNDKVKDLPFGGMSDGGEGYGCGDDLDPPIFVSKGCEDNFVIPNMEAMIQECSESRLWAGFHFTAAVTEGLELCKGVGVKAHEHVVKLRNGSTFNGGKFYEGDPKPTCSDPNYVSPNGDSAEEPSAAVPKSVNVLALFLVATAAMLAF